LLSGTEAADRIEAAFRYRGRGQDKGCFQVQRPWTGYRLLSDTEAMNRIEAA
jgi:hypothetical protein